MLDWTATNKVIVALGNNIYKWCPIEGKASKLYNVTGGENVCCIRGNKDGTKLAFGFSNGDVSMFDIQKQKIERVMGGQL